jgi:hypothetical protein
MPARGRDQQSFIQKRIGDRGRAEHAATAVRAKVDDDARRRFAQKILQLPAKSSGVV